MTQSILVSCEYATCAVPGGQRAIFEQCEDELHSHLGWEPGALNLAQAISMKFRTPLVHGEITRLLIDLEVGGDERWSRHAVHLSETTRERFAERIWGGYRATLRRRIQEDLQRHDAVVHVLVHAAGPEAGHVRMRTPDGNVLAAGLARTWAEAATCENLAASHVEGELPGTLIAELSASFPADRYAPIRLEVSPEYFLTGKPMRWEAFKKSLLAGAAAMLHE